MAEPDDQSWSGEERETLFCLSSASDLALTDEEVDRLMNHGEPDPSITSDPDTIARGESSGLAESNDDEGIDWSFLGLVLNCGLVDSFN